MKYYPIWIFIILWLCWACNNSDRNKAGIIEQLCSGTELNSTRFDSLYCSVEALPSGYAIPLLLKISEKPAISTSGFLLKEKCLLHAYNIASHKEKKKILYRMIVFYYEEMYCFVPELENYALTEGYHRCREYEYNYSLSDKEWEDLTGRKAEYLRWMNLYENALKLHTQLLTVHEKNDDYEKMISDLRAIAALYSLMHDKQESWNINLKAYNIAEKKGMKNRQEALLASLALEAYELGNYTESLRLLKKLQKIFLVINKTEIKESYFSIAQTYMALDSLDQARHYLRKTLDLKNPDGKADNYRRITDTFILEGREDSATYYLNLTIKEFANNKRILNPEKHRILQIPYRSFSTCINYARLLEKNGKTIQAIAALRFIDPVIHSPSLSMSNQKAVTDALNTYASLYRKTGEYDKALESLDLRDSMQNKYDLLQKEVELTQMISSRFKNKELVASNDWQAKQLNDANRILMLTLFLIVALMAIAGMFWWMYSQKKRQLSVLFDKQAEIDNLRKQQETKQTALSPEEEIFMTLENKLIQQKLFRDPEMSLDRISQLTGINRTYISSGINTCAGKNFNQWLNGHRIAYVIERLNRTTDLASLYTEAGFSSSASFYRSFKQHTSMSPKQYAEQLPGENEQSRKT